MFRVDCPFNLEGSQMLHAQNILPGDIPLEWLQEQDSFVSIVIKLLPTLVFVSHSKKCSGSVAGAGSSQVSVAPTPAVLGQENSNVPGPVYPLPFFEEVCHLQLSSKGLSFTVFLSSPHTSISENIICQTH